VTRRTLSKGGLLLLKETHLEGNREGVGQAELEERREVICCGKREGSNASFWLISENLRSVGAWKEREVAV